MVPVGNAGNSSIAARRWLIFAASVTVAAKGGKPLEGVALVRRRSSREYSPTGKGSIGPSGLGSIGPTVKDKVHSSKAASAKIPSTVSQGASRRRIPCIVCIVPPLCRCLDAQHRLLV